MAGPGLPVTVDADNADDGGDPTVKAHQQHHDALHAIANFFDLLIGTGAQDDVLTKQLGALAYVADPAVGTSNQQLTASSRIGWKLWVPKARTPAQIFWPLHNGGATLSGWYTAFFDATGALIPGSASADVSSVLQGSNPANSNILSGGGTITIPAGYFYLALACGTGTAPTLRTVPETNTARVNAGLTGSNAAAPMTAPRSFNYANAWAGSTPPATLGALSQDWRVPPLILR